MRRDAYPEIGQRITISQGRERRLRYVRPGVFAVLQGATSCGSRKSGSRFVAKMSAKSRNREHTAIRPRSWHALKRPAEPGEASMNRTGRLFARVVLSAIGALATHRATRRRRTMRLCVVARIRRPLPTTALPGAREY